MRTCQPCPLFTIQPLPGQSNCTPCPHEGVDCSNRSSVELYGGFYRPSALSAAQPYPCPKPHACLGGSSVGAESCAAGSTGPLCAGCVADYYSSRYKCEKCPTSQGIPVTVIVTLFIFLLVVAAVAAHFNAELKRLRRHVHGVESSNEGDSGCVARFFTSAAERVGCLRWVSRMWMLTPGNIWPIVGTIFKILIANFQLLYVFHSFNNVMWPEVFVSFTNIINLSQLIGIEVLIGKAIMPFHCVFRGTRISFYDRLLLTMVLPLAGSAFIFAIAVVVRLASSCDAVRSEQRRRKVDPKGSGGDSSAEDDAAVDPESVAALRAMGYTQHQSSGALRASQGNVEIAAERLFSSVKGYVSTPSDVSWSTYLTSPAIWSVHIWLVLLIYPSICRQIFATFNCVPFENRYLLYDDPLLDCFVPEYFPWMILAVVGTICYCFGIPVAAFALTRRYHGTTKRSRVQLLLASYHDDKWWFEGVDLLRKLFLTTIILYIDQDSKLQVALGLLLAVSLAMLYDRLQPYRHWVCGTLQLVCMMQIMFTYIAALVFYESQQTMELLDRADIRDHDTLAGVMLILANILCFVLLSWSVVMHMWRSSREVSDVNRLYYEDGTPITLSRKDGSHYDVFLSHQWEYGQDQCGTIKSGLRLLVPDMRVFLDVDDLSNIADLEVVIGRSDVFVVMFTRGYLTSPNCLRELKEALRLNKRMLIVQETDPNHGAVAPDQLPSLLDMGAEDRAACEELLLRVQRAQETEVVEWYREKRLKMATLRLIVTTILQGQSTAQPFGSGSLVLAAGPAGADTCKSVKYLEGSSVVGQRRSMKVRDASQAGVGAAPEAAYARESRGPARSPQLVLYLSKLYEDVADSATSGYSNAYEMLSEHLHTSRSDVQSEGVGKAPFILLLTPSTFDNDALVNELIDVLSEPADTQRPLVPLYSTAVPFAVYMTRCPPELKALGIFDVLFDKWPRGTMLQAVAANAAIDAVLDTLAQSGSQVESRSSNSRVKAPGVYRVAETTRVAKRFIGQLVDSKSRRNERLLAKRRDELSSDETIPTEHAGMPVGGQLVGERLPSARARSARMRSEAEEYTPAIEGVGRV